MSVLVKKYFFFSLSFFQAVLCEAQIVTDRYWVQVWAEGKQVCSPLVHCTFTWPKRGKAVGSLTGPPHCPTPPLFSTTTINMYFLQEFHCKNNWIKMIWIKISTFGKVTHSKISSFASVILIWSWNRFYTETLHRSGSSMLQPQVMLEFRSPEDTPLVATLPVKQAMMTAWMSRCDTIEPWHLLGLTVIYWWGLYSCSKGPPIDRTPVTFC